MGQTSAVREGVCRACGAAMLWAKMPSGRSNPLNAAEVPAEVGKGVIAFNPATGKGLPVTYAVIGDCERWAEQHGVSFHTSHFSDCPKRGQFRKTADPIPEESNA